MLTRRTFLACLPALALPQQAAAFRTQVYTPALWEELSARPDPAILNFRATWSMTCQIKQELLIEALVSNPAYGQLTFVDVDWDTYGQSMMAERLKVTRRSTLMVVRAGKEVMRIENEPYPHRVRALLDAALAA